MEEKQIIVGGRSEKEMTEFTGDQTCLLSKKLLQPLHEVYSIAIK